MHSADGNGGQKIWIVPRLGLTVVHLAGNYNQRGNAWNADRVLLEHLLPWALGVTRSYQHTSSRPVRVVGPGEWPLEPLPPEALARYVDTYEEQGALSIEIRSVGSRLQLVPPVEADEPSLDLIPVDDGVFLTGLVEGGEVRRVYWPKTRLVFLFGAEGRAKGYEVREPGLPVIVGTRMR